MTDRTALITGCSSGIGRATAEAFRRTDWEVYATARDADDVEDLADAGCETAALDVTDDDGVRRVVDRIAEEAGGVDCLVNNAGYGQFGPLEDLPTETVRRQFDVNVLGPHRLVRAVLPGMRERGDGTIVNLSSVFGRVSAPGQGAYAGSKFALEAMSDALRSEVDEHGVDVVLVEPGPVDTGFRERATDEMDDGTDRSGAYGTLYEFYEQERLVGGAEALSVPPEAVADVVIEAACSPDPAPRYPVGQLARLAILGRFLPDRWRDGLFRVVRRLVR